jgi:hypothetical protein
MAKLFGVATNSMINIFMVMCARYGRRNVAVLTNELSRLQDRKYHRRLKRAKLIMVSSVRDLQANLGIINKYTAPLLIFDQPLALQGYSVQMLDTPKDNKLISNFAYESLDYAELIDAIDHSNDKPHRLVRYSKEILPQIISEYTVAGFFDKFNTLMYAITTAATRSTIRNLMVRFVFDKLSVEEFDRQLRQEIQLTSKSRPLYQAVLDYMASDKGKILRQALAEANKMEIETKKTNGQIKRTVRYKEISEKYGVNKFDLKNLILLYRSLSP